MHGCQGMYRKQQNVESDNENKIDAKNQYAAKCKALDAGLTSVLCWTLEQIASNIEKQGTCKEGMQIWKSCVLMQCKSHGQIKHAKRPKRKVQKSNASIKMILNRQRVLDAGITSV